MRRVSDSYIFGRVSDSYIIYILNVSVKVIRIAIRVIYYVKFLTSRTHRLSHTSVAQNGFNNRKVEQRTYVYRNL